MLTKLTVTHNGKSTSGTFTYDQIGNPLTYFNGSNWTFTWRNGRQLATAKTGTKTTKYEYNADGLRTRKVNADGTSVDYFIVNGQTVAERWNYANGSEYFTMRCTFDETGSVIGFSTHYPNFTNGYWEDYLFAKNLQGDVVAMYLITVEPSRLIATYEYDEWGKVKTVRDATGAILTDPAHLANRNPFRYRGYHYDTETGFYYLQSRYYDPVISRFINADSYGSTGQGFIGTNMFAYCGNNPVNRKDPTGQFGITALIVTAVVAVCTVALSGCSSKSAPTSNVGAAQPYVNMPGSSDKNSPNCYAYAIGSPVNEQPGGRSGITPSKRNDVNDVGKSVEADLKAMGKTVRKIDGPNAKVYDNEFKIALRVGTQPYAYNPYSSELYYDYHFMRQTDTGQWAEKHGIGGAAILWDAGMTPDTISWTLNGTPYYDSPIIYYAVGK